MLAVALYKAIKNRKQSKSSEKSHSFQVVSALHLESHSQNALFDIPASAPYLVLAGGVGKLADYNIYRSFLGQQAARFKKIFLVLGPDEFFGAPVEEGLRTARRLTQEPSLKHKLVLLDKGRYDVPDSSITLLGCTLWSHIPQKNQYVCLENVEEFKAIPNWTIHDHNAHYEADASWLRDQVFRINGESTAKQQRRKILVVTHHLPSISRNLGPENQTEWHSAYATDLLKANDWDNVDTWAFGHTQYASEVQEGQVKVLSNQRVRL
ncbi:calcineurin-like phosphoesterase [Penicillium hispanicum]|uniref:calcineurin-like phosphoesterase n=1 Tax=Penicillium hispanicum TaxID=1080232 RepID=UPI00254137C1|nr:calcineurin-like phosphoesterase [Penicillium hispanicum]KAJ5578755.1 calcineurin-like phosphoesterase [Penicillium hispanicum]